MAEVVVEDWSVLETTGARSSMQETSSGKIVAQVHYASRLLRVMAKQDHLSGILLRICAGGREKCDQNHSIYMQIDCHIMTISRRLMSDNLPRCPRFLAMRPTPACRLPTRPTGAWDNGWGSSSN